ncbi:O-methyltransferase [Clostridium sp. DL1XJH146]
MDGITYDHIDNYLRSLINFNDDILDDLENYAHINNVPIVQKEVANLIRFIISIKKPIKILELGTAIGYSSILMNIESKNNSKITTIERSDKMYDIAVENIKKYNMDKSINVIKGDCLDVIQALNQKFDLIFIDAGKGHYNHYLPHCLRLLKDDGMIISDNVLFRGMVASDDLVIRRKITIVKRMREYLEEISIREDLNTTILPIGDGVAITLRRNNK